jgi:hypothetical protein
MEYRKLFFLLWSRLQSQLKDPRLTASYRVILVHDQRIKSGNDVLCARASSRSRPSFAVPILQILVAGEIRQRYCMSW